MAGAITIVCSCMAMYTIGIPQIVGAIGSIAGAIILGFLLYFQVSNRKEKKIIMNVLNDFASSWKMFLSSQPPKIVSFSLRSVMPILKKVSNIRAVIMSKPDILSNPYFSEALEIADEIESIRKREEIKSVDPLGSIDWKVSRKEIEDLATRARKCVATLGGRKGKK